MKTVAIIHGWAGGPWLTRRFSQALAKAGFMLTKDPSKADIFFAHLAGCYRLPKRVRAKLVVLVGVPYWPDKSILRRVFKKKNTDWLTTQKSYGAVYATKKSVWEAIYIIIKPVVTYIALRDHDSLDFLNRLEDTKTLVIRNHDDFLAHRQSKKLLKSIQI
jgi:hypothetical protein